MSFIFQQKTSGVYVTYANVAGCEVTNDNYILIFSLSENSKVMTLSIKDYKLISVVKN